MTKILLQFLPAIAPFVVYLIWARISHGRSLTETKGPWITLTALGFAFALITMIVMRIALQGAEPGGTYIAPHVKDGVLIPGQVVPADPE